MQAQCLLSQHVNDAWPSCNNSSRVLRSPHPTHCATSRPHSRTCTHSSDLCSCVVLDTHPGMGHLLASQLRPGQVWQQNASAPYRCQRALPASRSLTRPQRCLTPLSSNVPYRWSARIIMSTRFDHPGGGSTLSGTTMKLRRQVMQVFGSSSAVDADNAALA